MARYVVQRTFPEGLHMSVVDGGAELCRGVVERNAEEGVTWISSFVSEDKTASRNDLPVDQITLVRVLDPYFYA